MTRAAYAGKPRLDASAQEKANRPAEHARKTEGTVPRSYATLSAGRMSLFREEMHELRRQRRKQRTEILDSVRESPAYAKARRAIDKLIKSLKMDRPERERDDYLRDDMQRSVETMRAVKKTVLFLEAEPAAVLKLVAAAIESMHWTTMEDEAIIGKCRQLRKLRGSPKLKKSAMAMKEGADAERRERGRKRMEAMEAHERYMRECRGEM